MCIDGPYRGRIANKERSFFYAEEPHSATGRVRYDIVSHRQPDGTIVPVWTCAGVRATPEYVAAAVRGVMH